MTDLANETYVRLTTFTRDGRAKRTPVWIAGLGDGKLCLTAGDDTWKVKRIRATPAVEVTPSDGRGKVEEGAPTLTGTARIVPGDEADFAAIQSALLAKYGLQFRLFRFIARVRKRFGRADDLSGIVITPG